MISRRSLLGVLLLPVVCIPTAEAEDRPADWRNVYRIRPNSCTKCELMDLVDGDLFLMFEPDGTVVTRQVYKVCGKPYLNRSGVPEVMSYPHYVR